jgi:hypothetical protein
MWMDTRDQRAGFIWDAEVEGAIANCDLVIYVVTECSVGLGSTCRTEIGYAVECGKLIIPVHVDLNVRVPFLVSRYNRIQVVDGFDAAIEKLREDLHWYATTEAGKQKKQQWFTELQRRRRPNARVGRSDDQGPPPTEIDSLRAWIEDHGGELPRRSTWLAGSPDPAGVGIPPLLAYTADRHQQEEALRKLLVGWAKAESPAWIVCFLVGDEHQCHGRFLDYVEWELLRKRLPPHVRIERWLSDLKFHRRPVTELHELWRADLARLVDLPEESTFDAITMGMNKRQAAAVLQADFPSELWDAHAADRLARFLDLWTLLSPPGRSHPVIVCVTVTFRMPRGWLGGWRLRQLKRRVTRVLEGLATRTHPSVLLQVLPELGNVPQHEAELWARRASRDGWFDSEAMVQRVRKLYASMSIEPSDGLSMAQLGESLDAFLQVAR